MKSASMERRELLKALLVAPVAVLAKPSPEPEPEPERIDVIPWCATQTEAKDALDEMELRLTKLEYHTGAVLRNLSPTDERTRRTGRL